MHTLRLVFSSLQFLSDDWAVFSEVAKVFNFGCGGLHNSGIDCIIAEGFLFVLCSKISVNLIVYGILGSKQTEPV